MEPRNVARALVGLALAITVELAYGAVLVVDDTGDAVDAAPGSGGCDTGSGVCTLRAAVQEANALAGADTIVLGPGTYTFTLAGMGEDVAATGDLDVLDDLVIEGAGASATVIDPAGLDRALELRSGSLDVGGVTISGGANGGSGGAIRSTGGTSLVVREAVLTGNQASSGGAIESSGALRLEHTEVNANTAANFGGGLLLNQPTTLFGSTVAGNSSGSFGPQIWGQGSHTIVLINTTVSDPGVGIALQTGLLALEFWFSTIDSQFGAINASQGPVAVFAKGSIVRQCGADFTSGGYNLISLATVCVINGDLTGNIGPPADAMLVPLANNGGSVRTFALDPASPAIDAVPEVVCTFDDDRSVGTPEVPLTTDARNLSRPSGADCDIGAFERQPAVPIFPGVARPAKRGP